MTNGTDKNKSKEVSKDSRAPIWIIQLLSLVALVFLVYLEATISEFQVNRTVLFILGGAILPVDLIIQYIRYLTGANGK